MLALTNVSYLRDVLSWPCPWQRGDRFILNSVFEFIDIIKSQDSLSIYIRCDESLYENQELYQILSEKLKCIENISLTKMEYGEMKMIV